MTQSLAEAFHDQSSACADLGSPFMAQLMTLLGKRADTHSTLQMWAAMFESDLGPFGASLPLRIAGGLHSLAMRKVDPVLSELYPPNTVSDADLWPAVDSALSQNSDFWKAWLQNAPQTNEVRRSSALIAATHYLAQHFQQPFTLSELGASAGLNLMFDHFQMTAKGQVFGAPSTVQLAPEWHGDVPSPSTVHITERRGVDLNPLDITQPETQNRLLAYLWADQPERLALTRSAMSINDAEIDKGDAIEWLDMRLRNLTAGVHLIYHTIAWQYFPAAAQALGERLIESAGAKATATNPIAWLRMEADGQKPGAGLSLRLWPGDITIDLARVDFHGRWIDWHAPTKLDLPW